MKNESVFSYSSGGWKSKIKISAGLFLQNPILGLPVAASLLYPHTISPHLCVICVLVSGRYQLCWIRAHHRTPFYISHLFNT